MMELFTDWLNPVEIGVIGLVAGVLGGMLGVGGSVIIIPGMTIVLGYDQHLYQAAAMVANVAVSIPATMRHYKARAVMAPVLKKLLPVALITVLAGVAISNLPVFAGADGGKWLGRILALFLLYVIYENVRRLRTNQEPLAGTPVLTLGRTTTVGSAMGLTAGLLGIGGGALAVPLQQVVMKLPLRNCIANSAAIICISATIGSVYKIATLYQHDVAWTDGLLFGFMLAPTAWIGGRFGAILTHRLPLRQVRIAFIALMIVATWRMAALPWP